MMNIPTEGYKDMNDLKANNPDININSDYNNTFKTRLFEIILQAPFDDKLIEINALYYLKQSTRVNASYLLRPKKIRTRFNLISGAVE